MSRRVLPLVLVCWFGCTTEAPPPAPAPVVKAPPEPPKSAVDTAKPERNTAPRVDSIRWDPPRPTTLDHLRITVKTSDSDVDYVSTRYQWYRNGKKILHLVRDNVPAAEMTKGDVFEVEVVATDRDGLTGNLRSPEITIGNATPVFNMDPRSVRQIDGLKVIAEDPDEEPLLFSLSGAPKGMTIDKTRGVIKYKGSKDEPGGHYKIDVRATDPDKAFASWRFEIDVSPGSVAASASNAGTDDKAKPAPRRR